MTAALFASGSEWVGAGVRSIETGLHDLFAGAERRIVASAYALGGAAFDLPEAWVADALSREVSVLLVANRWDEQPRAATGPIERLARSDARLEIWSWDGPEWHELHAKVVVADERRALIGSPNWSGNGLLRNHELAVLVEGEAARAASRLVTVLTGSTWAHRRP
ncbi:MAG TPA: phospholipase D-like domain-containing protein [Allosphingosinicella sp.]|jgi:cardiolipin synthase